MKSSWTLRDRSLNAADADGSVNVFSGMVNLLLDFGDDDGWSGYVGPGVGFASIKYDGDFDDLEFSFDDSDTVIAWQIVAGVRTAITPTSSTLA